MKTDFNFLDVFGLGLTMQTSLIGTTITVFSKEDPDIYTSEAMPLQTEAWSDKMYRRLTTGTIAELASETMNKIVAKKGETNG